jgi:1,4-dihydroxy-2-naphthoyl-CoA hydrolase
MSIWRRRPSVEDLNKLSKNTLLEQLEIVFTEVGDDYLVATMPVDRRTHQPFGLLHGGASAVLAESLGSSAANCCLDMDAGVRRGAGDQRQPPAPGAQRQGHGHGPRLHIGRRTQVWETRIEDEAGKLACVSRLTLAVMPRGAS